MIEKGGDGGGLRETAGDQATTGHPSSLSPPTSMALSSAGAPASIVRVPLTHKDPSKSIFTKAFHHVRDWKTAAKNGRAFNPYSYIERKTRQATRGTVAYGPLGGELVEMAQISYQGLEACQTMYGVLWERLGRSNQKYRSVAKALDVLLYVVVRGSMEFLEMIKRDPNMIPTLERLEGFQYVMPDVTARDVGAGVRQKARELKRLLEDEGALNEARERGEIQSRKMAGMDPMVAVSGHLGDGTEKPRNDQPSSLELPGASDIAHVPAPGHSRTLSSESVTSTKGVTEDENALHMEALKTLLARPENLRCADCGLKSPRPSWASVNLGVFLCLRCAGIHRSLGVHVSQVRSCTLDVWTFEQLEVVLRCGGNAIANSFWECRLTERPEMMTIGDVERFVLQKYVERMYVPSDDIVWPPEVLEDEELEEILWKAMGEARREAYLSEKAGKAEMAAKAADDGQGAACVDPGTVPDVSLISLMDDDWPVEGNAMDGGLRVTGDAALGASNAMSPERKEHDEEQEFFESTLMGLGGDTGHAVEAQEKITPTSAPKSPSVLSNDDLSLLFSLDESATRSPQEPDDRRVSSPSQTSSMLEHEKKAVDLMAETLNDFDITSSIAKSVSPRSRPKALLGTSNPMRSG